MEDEGRNSSLERERALVARAQEDRPAFAEIYACHREAITGYLLRRTGRSDAAEDLCAEVFLVALRTFGRFRWRRVPLRHWLYRIANRALGRWSRRRARAALPLESEPAALPTDPGSRLDELQAALLRLPRRFQEVLALHHLEDLPVTQVAHILGCREGTVKSRLARARATLARELAAGEDAHEHERRTRGRRAAAAPRSLPSA